MFNMGQIGMADMKLNEATPLMEGDPETYECGRMENCLPVSLLRCCRWLNGIFCSDFPLLLLANYFAFFSSSILGSAWD